MFGNRVEKTKHKNENVTSIRPAKSKPQGRDRLIHFDQEIEKAKQAIVEMSEKIERLQEIVAGADVHHKNLQACIEQDNGRSLSDYSAGKLDADAPIARLVLLADNSKRASTAASAAVPSAIAQLENAQAQLLELGEQRAQELNAVLTMLGDLDADEYRKTFERLGLLSDKLRGFAAVSQMSHGDIELISEPLKAARFAFPSMRGHIDSDPFLRHKPSDLTVRQSAQKWTEIRERLSADANCDVNDLLIG
jgi:hypothetical protein